MSPWQWFCSTRTLSNSLETTLTIIALNYWPWQSPLDESETAGDDLSHRHEQRDDDYVHIGEGSPRGSENLDDEEDTSEEQAQASTVFETTLDRLALRNPLRVSLLLAALACILRPTNLLIWICLALYSCIRTTSYGHFLETRWIDHPIWVHITTLEFKPGTEKERQVLVREILLCG